MGRTTGRERRWELRKEGRVLIRSEGVIGVSDGKEWMARGEKGNEGVRLCHGLCASL